MIFRYLSIWKRYQFLLYQLVLRDFKVKYKRSVLGVLWSILHPLFMMLIMTVVFTNLFKMTTSGSMNYPVYIITGLVIFNFFTEATNYSLTAITGNFNLITKVHMPKYIFPVAKTITSCVNLFFSLIALYAVIFVTKEDVTWHHILLLYDFACLFLFTLGIGFILAALTVFFRDMIYLYNLLTLAWTYMTPIFYDISIVGDQMVPVFRANPMYQYVTFARNIILYHRIPSTQQFIILFVFGAAALIAGKTWFLKATAQTHFRRQ